MDKTIRELFEKRSIHTDHVFWSDHIESYVPKRPGNGHIATAINEQYDAFCDGYEAAKASEWISVDDGLPNFSEGVLIEVLPSKEVVSARYEPSEDYHDTNCWTNGFVWWDVSEVSKWKPLPKGPSDE